MAGASVPAVRYAYWTGEGYVAVLDRILFDDEHETAVTLASLAVPPTPDIDPPWDYGDERVLATVTRTLAEARWAPVGRWRQDALVFDIAPNYMVPVMHMDGDA